MNDNLFYQIALTMINGVGGITSRQLLNIYGDAKSIFKEKQQNLERIPGIGSVLSEAIKNPEVLLKAEREIQFIEKANIQVLLTDNPIYPSRLKECPDAPLVLYYKGNANLNAEHIISIVGTRHATNYGQEITAKLIEDISYQFPDTLIVSGLAYGIDVCAHRNALSNNLDTVAILAHGLDRIYPAAHRQYAVEMLNHGGLLTDFPSLTDPDRPNFLKRNRIIAGLSEATIVIESAEKGGSLVTADIAFSYSRDVFAFPGRAGDIYSTGCNNLIKQNKAGLITSANDLIDALGWQKIKKSTFKQTEMFFSDSSDSPQTQQVLKLFEANEELNINQMTKLTELSIQELTSILFDLEMDGRIQILPGNMYKLALK